MNLLGTGLSVQSLIDRVGITFDQLCELAEQYPDLQRELKRWYKRYEFVVKQAKPLETKENTEDKPKRSRKKVE